MNLMINNDAKLCFFYWNSKRKTAFPKIKNLSVWERFYEYVKFY